MPARDPGLQPERTALAWQRTGVAGAALAGTATVAAAHLAAVWAPAVVAALAALCAAAAAVAARSGIGGGAGGEVRASPWRRLLAIAAIPVLLAVTGVVLSLASSFE